MVSTHISTGIENAKTIISEALAVIKAWWAENGDEITAKALEIWTAVKDHISTGIENAKQIISEALAVIKAWWAENGDEITAKALEIWTAVKDHINTGIENAKEIISTALATILAWWDENGEKVTATVEAIWDGIKKAYKTASAFVLGIIASALAAIGGDWETAGEAWNTVVKDAWEKLKEAFKKGLEIIGNAVGDAWPRIKQAFSDGIENNQTAFQALIGGARAAIIEGIYNAYRLGLALFRTRPERWQSRPRRGQSVLGIQSPAFFYNGEDAVKWRKRKYGLGVAEWRRRSCRRPTTQQHPEAPDPGRIWGFWAGMVSLVNGGIRHFYQNNALFDAGQHIINILDEGMKDQIPGLVETAGDAGQAAYDATAGALGINSPSTTFYELGMWTTEGFINGISDTTPD
ncbi:MAG: hypothetical protein IPL28_26335 [Chloroflexi bacterium]|nr:hypothetical protein [Chloroflexota bacterium]